MTQSIQRDTMEVNDLEPIEEENLDVPEDVSNVYGFCLGKYFF